MAATQRLTNLTTGGPVYVDVAEGKIVRITPLELDESDGPSWTIRARGREFTPPRRPTLSNWTVAHKSTIYSPKRLLTPLKRVDFDPKGRRNLQNRGTSGYEPISWDMAFEKIAKTSGLKGRLIPVPSIISSGCGLAWRENPDNRALIDKIFEQYKIGLSKIYEIEI